MISVSKHFFGGEKHECSVRCEFSDVYEENEIYNIDGGGNRGE